MDELVQKIQGGHLEALDELLTRFKPLIISWLKRNKKLYSTEKEDYYSMAKVILLECALDYQPQKHVPFESYYKITLWHKTGNLIHKKEYAYVSLEAFHDKRDMQDFTEEYELKERLSQIENLKTILSESEQYILEQIMQGYTADEIGKKLGLRKKTILNKKYIIINKLREALENSIGLEEFSC